MSTTAAIAALHPVTSDLEALYPGELERQLLERDVTLVKLSIGDVETAVGFLASGVASPSLHPSSVGFRRSSLAPSYTDDIMDRSGLRLSRLSTSLVVSTDSGSFAIRPRSGLALDDATVLRSLISTFGSVPELCAQIVAGSTSASMVTNHGNTAIMEIFLTSDLKEKLDVLIRGVGLVPQFSAPFYWVDAGFNTHWATTPDVFAAEFLRQIWSGGAPVPHATARYVGIYVASGGDSPSTYPGNLLAQAVGRPTTWSSGIMLYLPVEEYGPQYDDITLVFSKTSWGGPHTHTYCFALRGASLVQTLEQTGNRPRGGVYVGAERFVRGITAASASVPNLLAAAVPPSMPATARSIWIGGNTTDASPFVRHQEGPIGLLIGPPSGMDIAAMGAFTVGSVEVVVTGHTLRVIDLVLDAHTKLARVNWAALVKYWVDGSGLYPGLSPELRDRALAGAADLEGKSLACVTMASPYSIPADVVDRIDLHRIYADAMEAACMEDDFLEQPYDSSSTKTWGDVDTYFRQTNRSLTEVSALLDVVSFDSRVFAAAEQVTTSGVRLVVVATPGGATLSTVGSTYVDTSDGTAVADLLVAGAPLAGDIALLDYVFQVGYAAEILKRKRAHSVVTVASAPHSDTANNPFDHSGMAASIGGWPLLHFMSQQDAWKAAIYSEVMLKGITANVHALLGEFKPNTVVKQARTLTPAPAPTP